MEKVTTNKFSSLFLQLANNVSNAKHNCFTKTKTKTRGKHIKQKARKIGRGSKQHET